jgi:hypothetical protein
VNLRVTRRTRDLLRAIANLKGEDLEVTFARLIYEDAQRLGLPLEALGFPSTTA